MDLPPRVLVADDQLDIIAALRLLLRSAGIDARGATSVGDVHAHLAECEYDAVLLDLNYARDTTSGAEGLQLIADLHARQPQLPVIAMTGWANIDTAVEAMRRGARGYIPKPWNNAALLDVVRNEVAHGRAMRRAGTEASREWSEARAIQRALLPATLPELAGCRLASRWEPASGFGGDYYDVIPLGEQQTALCIADVCGKGLPAALLMSNLQAMVRAFIDGRSAPHDAVTRINRALCRQSDHGRFVTLFVAVLDGRTRSLRYCNAGHNPPLIVRADGATVRLEAGGLVAGVFEDARFDSASATLAPGDRLVLFTDGLVEAGALGGHEYGDTRLVETIVSHRHLEPPDLIDEVFREAGACAGGRLDDDATALALAIEV
jgi:phosphoserine phosphatase RsbU/P